MPNPKPKNKKTKAPIAVQQTIVKQDLPLNLPENIISEILDRLNFLDILKLRKVSKNFQRFISDHYIEKLNQFFWGETFQEFKLTNLLDFKLHIFKPLTEDQKKYFKKTPPSEAAIKTFDSSLPETWNSMNATDFFFKKMQFLKTNLQTQYPLKGVDYYWPLFISAKLGLTEEFQRSNSAMRKDYSSLYLDIFLLNVTTNLEINQTILNLIKNNQSQPGDYFQINYSPEVRAFTIFESIFQVTLQANSQLKILISAFAEPFPKLQLRIFELIASQQEKLQSMDLYSYLLTNKKSFDNEDLEVFDFIKTGNDSFLQNYRAKYPSKKNSNKFDLRIELLGQLARKIQFKILFDFAESYLNTCNIIAQLSATVSAQFINLAIATQTAEIFKKFMNENSVVWKVLKQRVDASLVDPNLFSKAISCQCLEYILYVIQYFPNHIKNEELYQAGLMAYEKGRLEEFTNFVVKYCNTLSHIPLIIATQKNHIKIILSITDENVINTYFQDKTALHYAVEFNLEQIITILLTNKANLHARTTVRSFNYPVWYLALLHNHMFLAQQLLGRCVSNNPYLPLFNAIIEDNLAAVKEIVQSLPFLQLNHCALDGIYALDLASLLKREQIVSYFFEITNFAENPQNIIIAVKNNDLKLLQQLLDNGGDVKVRINEQNLLNYAMEHGYFDVAEYLLVKGAEICKKDFSYPILASRKSLLLRLFAADSLGQHNPDSTNTNLLFETYSDDIDICIELLQRNVADCNIPKKNNILKLFGKIARKYPATENNRGKTVNTSQLFQNRNYTTPNGMSLLAYALKCDNEFVAFHLSCLPDIDIIGKTTGCSPILLAAKKDSWRIVKMFLPKFIALQKSTNFVFYNGLVKEIHLLAQNYLKKSYVIDVDYVLEVKQILQQQPIIQIDEHLTQLGCSAEMQDALRVEDWIKIKKNLVELKTKSIETKILTYLWKLFVDRANPKKDYGELLDYIEKRLKAIANLSESSSDSNSDPDSDLDDAESKIEFPPSNFSSSEQPSDIENNPYRFNFNSSPKHSLNESAEEKPKSKKTKLNTDEDEITSEPMLS